MQENFTAAAYVQELISTVRTEFEAIEPVDAFEFITSSSYLGEDPLPAQSVIIKTFYGLWPTYPPTEEEQYLINVLRDYWKINIDLIRTDPILKLILVLGRRSTKSSIMSFLATYGMYRLVCLGNPQKHFHMRERHPIHITHVAAKGEQAEAVFTLTSDNLRKTTFFRPYIDFDKDTNTELRLFSPYDILANERIRQRNLSVPRGYKKESLLPGSLYVKSITTSAATNRGDATYLLMLSEFAHFMRAKIDTTKSEDQVLSENPQSDYAIAKALIPAVQDFGDEGRVVMESSPAEKGGEFYHHYCLGGGMEQEVKSDSVFEPSYQVIQFATWQARPQITRLQLDPEFRSDPHGAEMEYGAHFGNPSGKFISEELIASVPQAGRPLIRVNPGNWKFVIIIDPGGKAKSKAADTYAIAWGHHENIFGQPEGNYWVDGMHGFDAKVVRTGDGGRFERVPVNPNDVIEYVIKLVEDMGGRSHVLEIAYDQFDSTAPVATFQSLGYPAVETTFTNPYKASMYGDFLQKMQNGQVKMYGIDEAGWVERWRLEMKYLQQDRAGNIVYFHHPSSGPVQHDDFADCTSNLVHRLCLRVTPTKESIMTARKQGAAPIQRRTTARPKRGPALWTNVGMINPKSIIKR